MKKTRIALLLVVAVLVASAGIAQAALITNVVRANGRSGTNKLPIGTFAGDTAPLASPADGVQDIADKTDHTVFSDRTYPWINTPAGLLGSEYVRTFNDDKNTAELDVTYTVTLSQTAWLWMTIDNRTWAAFPTQQAAVDEITKAIGAPGTFFDSKIDTFIHENTNSDPAKWVIRPMSIFQAYVKAGTYVFGANYANNNFYTIGAKENSVPEPMTLALLGLGGLIASRKRS